MNKLISMIKSLYNSRLSFYLIILLLLIPPVICLIFIIQFGTNACYSDQWDIVPLFDKFYTGQNFFNDLCELHNEHRIFFPRIIMLCLGLVTHYNNIAEMLFSWVLLILISLILFKTYIKYFGLTKNSLMKFVPIVWLIFSLQQWQNFLWGFQIAWFMVVLFFLLTMYLLGKNKNNNIGWQFIAAILSGIIASFSSIQGLLVWPVGLVYMIIKNLFGKTISKFWFASSISIWIVAGISVITIYFVNSDILYHGMSNITWENITTMILYLLLAAGGVLGINSISSLIIGIFIVIIFLCICFYLVLNPSNIKKDVSAFAFSLILFSFLFILMIAIGRSTYGAGHALQSRYTTITIQGIVGLYILILAIEFRYKKFKTYLQSFFVWLIAMGLILSYTTGILASGPNAKASRVYIRNCLQTFEKQSDFKLYTGYIDGAVVRERALILKKYNLNVFSQ